VTVAPEQEHTRLLRAIGDHPQYLIPFVRCFDSEDPELERRVSAAVAAFLNDQGNDPGVDAGRALETPG